MIISIGDRITWITDVGSTYITGTVLKLIPEINYLRVAPDPKCGMRVDYYHIDSKQVVLKGAISYRITAYGIN
jgi:hypothetical protein